MLGSCLSQFSSSPHCDRMTTQSGEKVQLQWKCNKDIHENDPCEQFTTQSHSKRLNWDVLVVLKSMLQCTLSKLNYEMPYLPSKWIIQLNKQHKTKKPKRNHLHTHTHTQISDIAAVTFHCVWRVQTTHEWWFLRNVFLRFFLLEYPAGRNRPPELSSEIYFSSSSPRPLLRKDTFGEVMPFVSPPARFITASSNSQ